MESEPEPLSSIAEPKPVIVEPQPVIAEPQPAAPPGPEMTPAAVDHPLDDEQEGADLSSVFPESVRSAPWFRWTLIGVTLTGFLLCGGVTNWIMHAVMDADADRWVQQFRQHPTVVKQLGSIERGGYSFTGTLRATEEETVVFFVEGSKGQGELVVTEFGMKIPSVVLRMDGQKWTLQEGVAGPPPEEEH